MKHLVKRVMDILLSIICLILFLPIMILIAILIYLNMGSPVIFRQLRPGFHGKPFYIYKFRTMKDLRDENGNLLPDEQRLTRFGAFLRSTSLDELPELINVLKGDMSLVGPRPLPTRYLPRYNEFQMRRHEVKPGITGWTQVKGRNSLSWEEKFKLDVWYVDHWSILLDLYIIVLTIWKVLKHEGISAVGHVTMPEFKGDEAK